MSEHFYNWGRFGLPNNTSGLFLCFQLVLLLPHNFTFLLYNGSDYVCHFNPIIVAYYYCAFNLTYPSSNLTTVRENKFYHVSCNSITPIVVVGKRKRTLYNREKRWIALCGTPVLLLMQWLELSLLLLYPAPLHFFHRLDGHHQGLYYERRELARLGFYERSLPIILQQWE